MRDPHRRCAVPIPRARRVGLERAQCESCCGSSGRPGVASIEEGLPADHGPDAVGVWAGVGHLELGVEVCGEANHV